MLNGEKLDDIKKLIIEQNEIIKKMQTDIERTKKSCSNMDKHISFIHSIYNTIRLPLEYITFRINRIINYSCKSPTLNLPYLPEAETYKSQI